MEENGFFVVAVIIGSLVLGSVLWNYLRHVAQQSLMLSTTLCLIGFALVSSPLWGSIAIKGPQWEVTLLKRQSVAQAQSYLEILEAYQKLLPPQQAAQIAPAVKDFRASVQDLKKTEDKGERLKNIEETSKLLEELALTVTKLNL